MKPERAFVAERKLAQHCSELVRPVPLAAELIGRLEQSSALLTGALAGGLAPLFGFDAPAIEAEPASEGSIESLPQAIAAFASLSLLRAGKQQVPVLLAIDGQAVLRLVDRAFGGKGTVPDPLPAEFPLSAELMIGRLETHAITAMDRAWQLGGAENLSVTSRSADLARLAPFAPGCTLAVQRLIITESSGARWTITLAVPLAAIGDLICHGPGPLASTRVVRGEAHPADEPYGCMPFAVRAVLVDMPMPVTVVSALAVGQVLPVSVARSVPLRIGDRTIAHGMIGTLDERVAVQVTQAF